MNRMFCELLASESFGEEIPLSHRQRDALVDLRIPDNGFGILALGYGIQIAEKTLPQHQDAAVAGPQMLLGSIRDGSLADPSDKILIHDVARDPEACRRIRNGAMPRRDPFLYIVLNNRCCLQSPVLHTKAHLQHSFYASSDSVP